MSGRKWAELLRNKSFRRSIGAFLLARGKKGRNKKHFRRHFPFYLASHTILALCFPTNERQRNVYVLHIRRANVYTRPDGFPLAVIMYTRHGRRMRAFARTHMRERSLPQASTCTRVQARPHSRRLQRAQKLPLATDAQRMGKEESRKRRMKGRRRIALYVCAHVWKIRLYYVLASERERLGLNLAKLGDFSARGVTKLPHSRAISIDKNGRETNGLFSFRRFRSLFSLWRT